MSKKLKNLLPSIFGGGGNKDKEKATSNSNHSGGSGGLEFDAVGMPPSSDDMNGDNNNGNNTNTPTPSAELTQSVVRELSDPNYNSMEVAHGGPIGIRDAGALALPNANGSGNNNNALMMNQTNNTNVNNQQQLVMQFSNVSKVHFGSVINYNANIRSGSASASESSTRKNSTTDEYAGATGGAVTEGDSKRLRPRKTTSIVAMMQATEEPNHRILDTVATHLGEGWKQVMRDLGHSDGQIEQAIIDHQVHGGIKEVIYQLLLQWLRDADDGIGTLGHLTTLLWESNQRDCVQRMKLVWKSEAATSR